MSNKPIMKEYPDGSKRWYLNGECHRTDGPAIEHSNGTKIWYLSGERHRENGPAYDCFDGYKEWFLNDQHYSHIKGKLHNNNFLISDQYTGPIIIMGGKIK